MPIPLSPCSILVWRKRRQLSAFISNVKRHFCVVDCSCSGYFVYYRRHCFTHGCTCVSVIYAAAAALVRWPACWVAVQINRKIIKREAKSMEMCLIKTYVRITYRTWHQFTHWVPPAKFKAALFSLEKGWSTYSTFSVLFTAAAGNLS